MDRRYTVNRYRMLQDCSAISRVTHLFRFRSDHSIVAIVLVFFGLISAPALRAQQSVRTAPQRLKIESFKNPEALFRIGPLEELVTGSAGFDFTDNSSLTHTNKISRLSFFEELNLNTRWTLSQLNQLEFNFGGRLMEDFYGNGKSQVAVGISPDSDVQLQVAVGDFLVRVFDRFSYVQNPTSNPTVTNTTYLNNLTNVLGTVIDTDLNLAILSFSANYTYNNQSGSNPSSVQGQGTSTASGTRNSFRVGSSLSFKLPPAVLYGLETNLERTTGTSTRNNTGTITRGGGSSNVNSISLGPFIRGALTRLTDIDFSVGATLVDAKPSIAPDYYISAVIRHEFSRNWEVILSGSHDLVFTTGTDVTEENSFRLATRLNLTRFITFTAAPYINFGSTKSGSVPGSFVNGVVQGSFTQYGVEAGLAWRPRKHLSTELTYYLIRREADTAAGIYTQNSIAFFINYTF